MFAQVVPPSTDVHSHQAFGPSKAWHSPVVVVVGVWSDQPLRSSWSPFHSCVWLEKTVCRCKALEFSLQ